MGAKYSPSLANFVMSWWEEVYIYTYDNPFQLCVHWYRRYIDDVLIIWRGGGMCLLFTQYLNNYLVNLKFGHSTTSFFGLEPNGINK